MPNANEMARELAEERDALLDAAKRRIPKGSKEILLRRIGQIERELGMDNLPGYNSGRYFEARGK